MIAFNGGDGVLIQAGIGQLVLSDSIFDNGGLGIRLAGTAPVTPAPVLTAATSNGTTVTVTGSLAGALPLTTYMVQFFTDGSADPSGSGEGRTLLNGNLLLNTDASGGATFRVEMVVPGRFVTATATPYPTPLRLGNTSQFSKNLPVT